jgi:hypothetical protein
MENWERGIVVPNSDAEDEEPQEEIPEEERPAGSKENYLTTWETSSVVADFEADRVVACAPSNRILRENEIIKPQDAFANYRRWRLDSISANQKMLAEKKAEEEKKLPKPRMCSATEVFRPAPAVIEDEELAYLTASFREAQTQRLRKQEADYVAQLEKAKKQASLRQQAADTFVHPEIRMREVFQAKQLPQTPTHSTTVGSIAEESAESCDDLEADATHLVHQLILQEKARQANMQRADQSTTDLSDMRLEHQPANVFERMWTPVCEDNPIWRRYRQLFNEMRRSRTAKHQQLAACASCMTIFTPFFPAGFHLHRLSKGFKTAADERRFSACVEAVVEADEDAGFYESPTYKALVALAKEAKAYKKDGGDEYIKLLRVVQGVRSHRGKGKYDRLEICENCEVESDLQEAAKKRFKVQTLARGILELVFR